MIVKFKWFLWCLLFSVGLVACGTASNTQIESFTSPGFCKSSSGQDLSNYECNQKMSKEQHPTDAKSESEVMLENVDRALKKPSDK